MVVLRNGKENYRFRGKIDQSIIAEAEEVNRSIYKKNTLIVDARSIEEYEGSEVRGARRGHIPSAINIDWVENVENGTFKTKDKLSSIYSKIPADRKIKIITYCQGGYRAAHSLLALKILGYENVKMYLGSWGEWGNRSDLPVEQN